MNSIKKYSPFLCFYYRSTTASRDQRLHWRRNYSNGSNCEFRMCILWRKSPCNNNLVMIIFNQKFKNVSDCFLSTKFKMFPLFSSVFDLLIKCFHKFPIPYSKFSRVLVVCCRWFCQNKREESFWLAKTFVKI